MAHPSKVLRSIETDDGGRCVDIFVRPDGTFGFEEYRRDSEDGRGWFAIGFHASGVHATADDALSEARANVEWLADALARLP
jgi:hypothetical protein